MASRKKKTCRREKQKQGIITKKGVSEGKRFKEMSETCCIGTISASEAGQPLEMSQKWILEFQVISFIFYKIISSSKI